MKRPGNLPAPTPAPAPVLVLVPVLLLLLLLLSTSSCGKREVKIDRIMERAIDTTASSRKAILRPQLDSLCVAQFDSLVQAAVDSILAQRRAEIDKIIKK